ncbi:MAG: 30S ribosomal protein S17 [Planctomycetes bacterium]|jgi:small subunit ribosomal protein S17|nr:30S ribosomal protein S17 [Phycisphaerae bacterium]NBB96073.1 30S ribosomal protein S17 [Planctomycetota bacterium]
MNDQETTVETQAQDAATASTPDDTRHRHRTLFGKVAAVSGEKTISVQIENLVKHPIYGKYVGWRRKLAVHDEHGAAKVGDVVAIIPCTRLSKRKAHRLVRVVRESVIERI